MQGAQRYVVFAYLALGVLVWATLAKLFHAIALLASLPDPEILGSNFTLTTLLGLLAAIGGGVYALKNARAYDFSTDVVGELRKVTWPSRRETQTATVVVIITTIIVAIILGFFDAVWSELTGLIYA